MLAHNVNWTLPAHLRHSLDSPITASRLQALDGLSGLVESANRTVRQRVLAEVRRLVDDDSRAVSAAATALLAQAGARAEADQNEAAQAAARRSPVRPANQLPTAPEHGPA